MNLINKIKSIFTDNIDYEIDEEKCAFITKIEKEIEKLKKELTKKVHLLEDETSVKDTEKYSELIYEIGEINGRIESLKLSIAFYKRTIT